MDGFRRCIKPPEETSVSRPVSMNVEPPVVYNSSDIEEDWKDISCLKERRRVQNRNAQRKYRHKIKLRLARLERREDTGSRSMKAVDGRPPSTAADYGGEQLVHQETPISSVPEEFQVKQNPGRTLFPTSLPPTPYSAFYNIDDPQRRQVYTEVDVQSYTHPHSTTVSPFESITPSVVYDEQKWPLVNDMTQFPFDFYYPPPESLWTFQQVEMGAMT